MNKNVLIIGYGTVGRNLHNELKKLNPDIYDKYKGEYNNKKDIKYDFAFICVDTPKTKTEVCDYSQVIDAINENDAEYYIVKSTILPTTTDVLNSIFPDKKIIFSPEFYGGTQHCNNFEFDFTILGGYKEHCVKVQQLLQEVYDARHQFRIVSSVVAELEKYMENSYLAMKVTFCCEFYKIAQKYGVKYEELRELFILDPRVNPSHTFVYDEHPYYESHCLDKDVPAIAEVADSKLLKQIIKINEENKKL